MLMVVKVLAGDEAVVVMVMKAALSGDEAVVVMVVKALSVGDRGEAPVVVVKVVAGDDRWPPVPRGSGVGGGIGDDCGDYKLSSFYICLCHLKEKDCSLRVAVVTLVVRKEPYAGSSGEAGGDMVMKIGVILSGGGGFGGGGGDIEGNTGCGFGVVYMPLKMGKGEHVIVW